MNDLTHFRLRMWSVGLTLPPAFFLKQEEWEWEWQERTWCLFFPPTGFTIHFRSLLDFFSLNPLTFRLFPCFLPLYSREKMLFRILISMPSLRLFDATDYFQPSVIATKWSIDGSLRMGHLIPCILDESKSHFATHTTRDMRQAEQFEIVRKCTLVELFLAEIRKLEINSTR